MIILIFTTFNVSLSFDTLRSQLNLEAFLQDCTPLRNFVNGYGKRRALYILVKRTSTTGSTSALLPHTIATDKEQKAWKAPAPVTVKKGHNCSINLE